MYFRQLDQLAKVIENAFSSVTKVRKNFKTFFIEAMIFFIAIPKRVNFTQMSRFGDSCESRFRQNFQKPFDWICPTTFVKISGHEVCQGSIGLGLVIGNFDGITEVYHKRQFLE